MTAWLDVSDTPHRIAYTATAGQTAFTVPYVFFEEGDLGVFQNGTLLTLGTHYTVSGAESPTGGTVTLVSGATAGDEITITRELLIEQTTHIPPSGPLDVPAINIQISKLIAIAQQLRDTAIRLPDGDPTLSLILDAVASRKNKLLGFGASGELIYPLGPTFVGDTFSAAAEVDSRATAQVTSFAGSVNIVNTGGYTTPGDGSYGPHKRVGSLVTTGAGFQSADGAWWEIAKNAPSILDFGAHGGFGDDTAAFDRAFAWLNQTSEFRRTLIIPAGNYGKTGTHTITGDGARLLGEGGRVSTIAQLDDLNSIVFSDPTPTTGISTGTVVEGLGIRRTCGTSASTGIDLKLIGQFHFWLRDVCLLNAVNGLDIQGGDSGFINGLLIQQNQDILVRRVGSTLFKIGSQLNGGAINNHANSIFVSDFNVSGMGLNNFVDYSVQMTGGDGVLFSNGHLGLTGKACCLLNPSAIAGDYFSSIGFSNVFFDGSGISEQAFAIQSGNAGQTVTHTKINNCQIGGGTTNGLNFDYPTINSCITSNNIDGNTLFGFILNGGASTQRTVFVGNTFSANGTDYAGDALENATTVIQGNYPGRPSVQTTPTVTSNTGAFTTVASTVNKRQVGKLVYFDITISITTNGTAAGGVKIVSFGTTPVRTTSVVGKNITSGKNIGGYLNTSGQLLDIFNYDGTYPGANATVLELSGFCEVA